MLGLLHGLASITLFGNQVISGLAINTLASGFTVTIGYAIFQQGGQTPQLGSDSRFGPIILPFADGIGSIPVVGPIYREVISGHNLLVWVALLAVVMTAFVVSRTRFGLRLRAVGEKPEALDCAGVSVVMTRYQALIIAGVLCGIAGAIFPQPMAVALSGDDGRQGLYCAGGDDLRQMATARGLAGMSAVRLS